MARAGEVGFVIILNAEVAGSGTFAEVFHNGIGSIFDLRFKLKASSVTPVLGDSLRINPFFFQRLNDKTAKTVVAYTAYPTDLQAQPGKTGRHIEFSASNALDKLLHIRQFAGLRGDKHRHRFTNSDHIQ